MAEMTESDTGDTSNASAICDNVGADDGIASTLCKGNEIVDGHCDAVW